jgi:hypothetical protein
MNKWLLFLEKYEKEMEGSVVQNWEAVHEYSVTEDGYLWHKLDRIWYILHICMHSTISYYFPHQVRKGQNINEPSILSVVRSRAYLVQKYGYLLLAAGWHDDVHFPQWVWWKYEWMEEWWKKQQKRREDQVGFRDLRVVKSVHIIHNSTQILNLGFKLL